MTVHHGEFETTHQSGTNDDRSGIGNHNRPDWRKRYNPRGTVNRIHVLDLDFSVSLKENGMVSTTWDWDWILKIRDTYDALSHFWGEKVTVEGRNASVMSWPIHHDSITLLRCSLSARVLPLVHNSPQLTPSRKASFHLAMFDLPRLLIWNNGLWPLKPPSI